MLEGLSAVDWESQTHAYGPAGDVPDMIRALGSPDPEEWVDAIEGLYATLCHQACTVYQATALAVPFLVELLGYRKVRCRGRILEFLGDTARATSYLAAHGDHEEQGTEEFKEQLDQEMKWVRQAREAIWNGLDVYLDLLTDLEKRLRITVPYTLGLLVGFAHEEIPRAIRKRKPFELIAKRLARQLEDEPSELVQASVIFSLGHLVPQRVGVRRLLERQVKARSVTKLIRLSAALSLSADATKPSAVVLDVLLDALKNPKETNHLFDADQAGIETKHHPLLKAYRKAGSPLGDGAGTGSDPNDIGKDEDFKFPWLDRWATFIILERLSWPDADYLERVIPLVTPYLDAATGYTVDSLVSPVLRLVFGERKVTRNTRRKDLTPAQIEVLQRLYDNLKLWATDSGNVDSAFDKFGLTHNRKNWKLLLGIKNAPLSATQIEEILATIVPDQQSSWEGQTVKRINLREIGTGAFLPHLKQYRDLEDLDLSSVPLSDADLIHLAGFRKLQKLHIPNTAVTDTGVEALTALKDLRELNLSCTRITDAALTSLKNLPKLTHLMLWKVPVSERALTKFQNARPKCKVSR
jgi:Leucine-rich repeat (LRR) protein